jgi:hypothetical protein
VVSHRLYGLDNVKVVQVFRFCFDVVGEAME